MGSLDGNAQDQTSFFPTSENSGIAAGRQQSLPSVALIHCVRKQDGTLRPATYAEMTMQRSMSAPLVSVGSASTPLPSRQSDGAANTQVIIHSESDQAVQPSLRTDIQSLGGAEVTTEDGDQKPEISLGESEAAKPIGMSVQLKDTDRKPCRYSRSDLESLRTTALHMPLFTSEDFQKFSLTRVSTQASLPSDDEAICMKPRLSSPKWHTHSSKDGSMESSGDALEQLDYKTHAPPARSTYLWVDRLVASPTTETEEDDDDDDDDKHDQGGVSLEDFLI